MIELCAAPFPLSTTRLGPAHPRGEFQDHQSSEFSGAMATQRRHRGVGTDAVFADASACAERSDVVAAAARSSAVPADTTKSNHLDVVAPVARSRKRVVRRSKSPWLAIAFQVMCSAQKRSR